MAEWQKHREPPPEQGKDTQRETSPLSGKLRATQPRLTLPSIPRVPAVPPTQRPATAPRSPVVGGLTPGDGSQAFQSPRPASSPRLPTPGASGGLLTRAGMRHTAPLRQPTPSQPSVPPASKPAHPFARTEAGAIQNSVPPAAAPARPFTARDGSAPGAYAPSTGYGIRRPAPLQPLNRPAPAQLPTQPGAALPLPSTKTGKSKGVMIIPGNKKRAKGGPHQLAGRAQLAILICALAALALGVVFGGALKNGASQTGGRFGARPGGNAGIAQAPVGGPTLPPELDTTDTHYYITKYGFDAPGSVKPLPDDELQRLKQMQPYALAATARYDARYQGHVEPEMLLWWTHAEEIGARINYSNCANESPPSGSYFVSITNCDRPDFWQLGYGNQFGNIWVLKDAFSDMHGDPNDASLVQQVGQAVLDYDRSQHTSPLCGGYACTFPRLTIDQIMADVHWHASDHRETDSNWWAAVLSRDPGINSYMLALALSSFSHAQTRNWVGCYYQEPCWQYESDSIWQILENWKALGG